MPQIPTVALSEVPAAPAMAPRASADAYNATNRALGGVGAALQDAGATLGRFAQEKQAQVNRGILAAEETVRMQTAAQIEAYADENQGTPESWGKFRDSAWKGYEQGRARRAKEQGWGPRVVAEDKMLATAYQAETGIRFRSQENKALIRQSNDRLRGNATARAIGGDWNGALEVIDQMNQTEGQKIEARQSVISDGMAQDYGMRLANIGTLSNADQFTQLKALQSDLIALDEKGQPVNGVLRNGDDGEILGGLDPAARTRLVNSVNEQLSQVDRAMFFEVGKVAAEMESDVNLGLQMWNEATVDGRINSLSRYGGVLTRTLRDVDAIQAGQQKRSADANIRRSAETREKQLGREDTLDGMIAEGKKTPEDVVAERTQGRITEEGAQRLIARANALAEVELKTPWKQISRNPSSQDVRGKILLYASTAKEPNREAASAGERQAMLMQIDYLPISPTAKAKLMRDFVDASTVDILGWEEGRMKKIDGRKVDAVESTARANLYNTYRATPNLGQGWAGQLLLDQERQLTALFTSDEYGMMKPTERAKAAQGLVDSQRRKVAETATGQILDGLYTR